LRKYELPIISSVQCRRWELAFRWAGSATNKTCMDDQRWWWRRSCTLRCAAQCTVWTRGEHGNGKHWDPAGHTGLMETGMLLEMGMGWELMWWDWD